MSAQRYQPPVSRWCDLRFLNDGRNAQLLGDVEFAGRRRWFARRGLVTDGASIPALLWPLIGGPFEGRHRRAAILHDSGYRQWACEITRWRAFRSSKRAVVDRMIFEVSCADGTKPWRAVLIYAGVRIGGWVAWRQHALRKRP